MLGIPAKAMEVNWSDIILKAITIKGVYGREMFETWRKMLALIHAGLDLTPLITHRVALDDVTALQTSMGTPERQVAGGDVPNFAGGGSTLMIVDA